jgi:hypothetical protein
LRMARGPPSFLPPPQRFLDAKERICYFSLSKSAPEQYITRKSGIA